MFPKRSMPVHHRASCLTVAPLLLAGVLISAACATPGTKLLKESVRSFTHVCVLVHVASEPATYAGLTGLSDDSPPVPQGPVVTRPLGGVVPATSIQEALSAMVAASLQETLAPARITVLQGRHPECQGGLGITVKKYGYLRLEQDVYTGMGVEAAALLEPGDVVQWQLPSSHMDKLVGRAVGTQEGGTILDALDNFLSSAVAVATPPEEMQKRFDNHMRVLTSAVVAAYKAEAGL